MTYLLIEALVWLVGSLDIDGIDMMYEDIECSSCRGILVTVSMKKLLEISW